MIAWSDELMRWALTMAALLVVTGCIVCWVVWTEKRMNNVIVGRWPGSSDEPRREQSKRDQIAEIIRDRTGCTADRAADAARSVLDLIGDAEPA